MKGVGVACWFLVMGLAALLAAGCAELPQVRPRPKVTLVFPPPPDTPRFYYERTLYTSRDIGDEDDSQLRTLLTGETVRGEALVKPYAVAVRRGRIYVSDSVERFIKVFDVPSGKYMRIGDEEPGTLGKPFGIDVDAAGNLYVADGSQQAVMVYDRDGKFLRRIGGKNMFDRMSSVTVDASGARIYVTDIGGVQSQNHRVRVFDAHSGKHLFDIGKRGSGDGEFNLPRDVAIGKEGRLYVVDGGNFRVQIFDRDGKFLKSFGGIGKQPGTFARPKEVATDRDGNVYVVDTAFGNFQIFDADGQLLMFVGDRSERDGPAKYMLPSGIYVDEDGRVYFVDQWFRKIDVFRPAGLPANEGSLVRRVAAPLPKTSP